MSANLPMDPGSQAQSRAWVAEERFRLLVDSVRDYAIFMLQPDGTVATWNAGARRIKGYEASEIIGSHMSRFYTEEDRASDHPRKLLDIAAREGRVEDEGWRVRKDGTRFWADVVLTAVRSPEGELIGFAKVTRDLTDRRRAEERLRESEERFRLLVGSVQDYAIVMLDPSGRVRSWNPGAARIKGYSEDEIIGQHMSVFYPPEDVIAGKPALELERAARDGHFEVEGWRVRKDGSRFLANTVLSAVRDSAGQIIGFASVTRDLTERRRAESGRIKLARAQEAIRLRDEFLSIASHELKTPLTAMRLQLQSLINRLSGEDARANSKLERAVKSTDRLADLIETLLDVSRISRGPLRLNREPVTLNELVQEVIERFRAPALQAGCEIRVHADGMVRGCWDRLRLEQVLTNLVSNAVKYAAGKPIEIEISQVGGEALLRVADGGPGIPEQDMERIFGRFERAASMRHYGGLGLGLYVAREIVVAHGGSISVSNRPTGGALFTVRLPLAAKASAGPELEATAGRSVSGRQA